MDIHCHLAKTEVIGLLGGLYCPRLSQLQISRAEPCVTVADHDLQCEMDPVSQALANERLAKSGYQVVGWYHSHPTFVPNPSLRDLETQARYQELFGSQPFVAIIISPYFTVEEPGSKNWLVSKYKCLIASNNSVGQVKFSCDFLYW